MLILYFVHGFGAALVQCLHFFLDPFTEAAHGLPRYRQRIPFGMALKEACSDPFFQLVDTAMRLND